MLSSEIRSRFLEYFKKNGHFVVESSSLVPTNDPTLLFTNAGMVQFKDVFLGRERLNFNRATSSQKCARAGGKHNDLENVGFTSRHHVFFEMLGNFSFGDYFKKEAIHYAWEFLTKELGLAYDKLYVSVYKDDDEAAEIWHNQENVPKDKIFRFGDKDNFWSMGDTGPCGPCSEIFYDRGKDHGCNSPTCNVGCDCDRYIEIWNLVFMQFDRDESGKLTPLPKPSVDTGSGLERVAAILQDAQTNYETDLFTPYMNQISKMTGLDYKPGSKTGMSFRVIADHIRSSAFLISDGVMPSNEGRGYVLRRILRRAIRHGRLLGFNAPFLNQLVDTVVRTMGTTYKNLATQQTFIEKAIQAEEDQFFKTLERGLEILESAIKKYEQKAMLPGDVAFKLYDTYGFPLDLTEIICNERGLNVDHKEFEKAMAHQRSESRKHWKGSGDQATSDIFIKTEENLREKKLLPKFVGYEKLNADGVCVHVFPPQPDEDKNIFKAVFDITPFYGESGGQVGDTGIVLKEDGSFYAKVIDTQKPTGRLIILHLKIKKGELKTGETYRQEVAPRRRALIEKNHTATHLLHWALREVLGKHVKQAGSLVTPEMLRFDFAHFKPVTSEEIKKVETMVNEKIWENFPVTQKTMEKNAAINQGAIAFFGEKYGDTVRTISAGAFSTELCGGTHVDQTGLIHIFEIISESSIAAGVRRIFARTSEGALHYLKEKSELLKQTAEILKVPEDENIIRKIKKNIEEEKALKNKIESLEDMGSQSKIDNLIKSAKKLPDDILFINSEFKPHADGIKQLRKLSDLIKQSAPDSVIVIGNLSDDETKAFILTSCNGRAAKKYRADLIINELLPIIDGRGGGKPQMAQAGGTKPDGLKKALENAKLIVLKG